jgi:hypothetical protein
MIPAIPAAMRVRHRSCRAIVTLRREQIATAIVLLQQTTRPDESPHRHPRPAQCRSVDARTLNSLSDCQGSLLLFSEVPASPGRCPGCFPVPHRRLPVASPFSARAAFAAVLLLAPSLAVAQVQITTAPNGLPPGLGSGALAASPPEGRVDAGPAASKPAFKELRLDGQTGALNSFVRIGLATNGQGQESAESRSSGSSVTGNPSERRSPELFKLGGNIKF